MARTPVKRRLAALIAALAALFGVVAVAGAVFSAPVTLSAAGYDAEHPQIASDADGDAVAVWERFEGGTKQIEARTISAAGAVGPIEALSATGQDTAEPQIASDSDGHAVAVWRGYDTVYDSWRLYARAVSTKGVVGPIKTLSHAGQNCGEPQISRDADGDAIVVWERSDGPVVRVNARTIPAAGPLGRLMAVSPAGYEADHPQIASDADGDAIVVWARYAGSDSRVQARTVSTAGVLGPVKTLTGSGHDANHPQVASDAEGNAIVVWERKNGSISQVQARTISAAGALGQIHTLSVAGPYPGARAAQIASDAEGGALVVWQRPDGTTSDRIQARTISAAGVLGQIETLSAAGHRAGLPQIANDAEGGAVAVWQGVGSANYGVQARAISAAGTLGPIEALSATDEPTNLPQIASDADGDVAAVWERPDGSDSRVQASQGP